MFPEARGVEFLIIAAIALIVVGPKELPGLLRKVGQFVGKMRNIANDFRTSFDEMARQSELDDLRKQVEEMRAQTAAAIPSDPMGEDPEMLQFRRDFDAQTSSAVDYGSVPAVVPPESPAVVAKPRKRASKPKTTAVDTAPVKPVRVKAPAAKKPSAKSAPPKVKRPSRPDQAS